MTLQLDALHDSIIKIETEAKRTSEPAALPYAGDLVTLNITSQPKPVLYAEEWYTEDSGPSTANLTTQSSTLGYPILPSPSSSLPAAVSKTLEAVTDRHSNYNYVQDYNGQSRMNDFVLTLRLVCRLLYRQRLYSAFHRPSKHYRTTSKSSILVAHAFLNDRYMKLAILASFIDRGSVTIISQFETYNVEITLDLIACQACAISKRGFVNLAKSIQEAVRMKLVQIKSHENWERALLHKFSGTASKVVHRYLGTQPPFYWPLSCHPKPNLRRRFIYTLGNSLSSYIDKRNCQNASFCEQSVTIGCGCTAIRRCMEPRKIRLTTRVMTR